MLVTDGILLVTDANDAAHKFALLHESMREADKLIAEVGKRLTDNADQQFGKYGNFQEAPVDEKKRDPSVRLNLIFLSYLRIKFAVEPCIRSTPNGRMVYMASISAMLEDGNALASVQISGTKHGCCPGMNIDNYDSHEDRNYYLGKEFIEELHLSLAKMTPVR